MQSIKKLTPWAYIPTLYFAEGLPYIIINVMLVTLLKSLDVSNEMIGLTSLFYLPWTLKPLWSPVVDGISTKRNWLLMMNLCLAIVFILAGSVLFAPNAILLLIIVLSFGAILSATHDIAIDGYYLHALDKGDQAFYTGIRSTFYRLAMIFGTGVLVILAGSIGNIENSSMETGWTMSFIVAGVIFLGIYFYHRSKLPTAESDVPIKNKLGISFVEAFTEYFKQKKILVIVAFILTYRLGEGLLVKMAQPFLMDSIDMGGFEIGVIDIGIMYGTVGVISLVVGGILGGFAIKKYSLKKLIFPMALAMNLPNLLYYFLSINATEIIANSSFLSIPQSVWIQGTIIVEQFGYGFGFTAFLVYLLHTSKGKYKSSHYAISTGIMALGMMLPGVISGFLEQNYGYTWLFAASFVCAIPGMIIIFYLPFPED
jgi:MFS transporter, PAT family, beta-lactamase induction signal transducer AmpG